MILVDLNQVMISNLMAQIGNHHNVEIDDDKILLNIDQSGIEYNLNKIRSDYNWENNSYKLIDLYDRVLS